MGEEFLKTVPVWFLIVMVIMFGGFSLYSVKQMFASLQATLQELKDLIEELFNNRNNHESRLNVLETRCSDREKMCAFHKKND